MLSEFGDVVEIMRKGAEAAKRKNPGIFLLMPLATRPGRVLPILELFLFQFSSSPFLEWWDSLPLPISPGKVLLSTTSHFQFCFDQSLPQGKTSQSPTLSFFQKAET